MRRERRNFEDFDPKPGPGGWDDPLEAELVPEPAEDDTEVALEAADEQIPVAEAEAFDAGTGQDAVGAYLETVGRVPLLTREQEVELAKRIEAGRHEVRARVFALPLAWRYAVELAKRLRSGSLDPRVAFAADEDAPAGAFDERVRDFLGRADELDRAVELLREASRLAGATPEPHFDLGVALELRADAGGAWRAYGRALEIDPEYLPALLNACRLAAAQGRVAEARRLARRALAVGPSEAERALLEPLAR